MDPFSLMAILRQACTKPAPSPIRRPWWRASEGLKLADVVLAPRVKVAAAPVLSLRHQPHHLLRVAARLRENVRSSSVSSWG